MEDQDRHAWLEDALAPEEAFEPRFTEQDIATAREARRQLGPELCYLAHALPSPGDLPDTATICAVHEELTQAAALGVRAAAQDIPPMSMQANDALSRAERLLECLRELCIVHQDLAAHTWLRRFYDAWRSEGTLVEDVTLFDDLLANLRSCIEQRRTYIQRPVELPEFGPHREQVVKAINRAKRGQRAFPIIAFGRQEAKSLFSQIRISGQPPAAPSDWEYIAAYLVYESVLRALTNRWNALTSEFNLPEVAPEVSRAGRWLADMSRIIERLRNVAANYKQRIGDELRILFPYGIDPHLVAHDAEATARAMQAVEIHLDVHFINTLPVHTASRHSRESGNPGNERHGDWMPACAGMTFYWRRTYETDI